MNEIKNNKSQSDISKNEDSTSLKIPNEIDSNNYV